MRENRPRRPERQDDAPKGKKPRWYEEDDDSDEDEPHEGLGAKVWRVLTTPMVRSPSITREGKPTAGNIPFRITVLLRGIVWLMLISETFRIYRIQAKMMQADPVVAASLSSASVFQLLYALVLAIAFDAILRLPSAGRSQ